MYQICLEDVTVRYPSERGQRTILDQINLNIRQGEFLSLVGPTGCGKSTVLRMILGSQYPTEGKALFDGAAIADINRHRGIVFQKYSLFPHKTVLENIAFGPMLEKLNLWDHWLLFLAPHYRKVREESIEEAREFVRKMGLDPSDCDKYPYELSGGMRQRVALAQTLIMRPKVMLMDEAFSALDINTRADMQLLLLEEWERHRLTVIFVTHSVDEAVFLGTRIVGLSQHWSGDDGKRGNGARIVTDVECPGGHPKPTTFRTSAEFRELVEHIRENVLDPANLRHRREFNLTHRDAWNGKEETHVTS